MTVNVRVFKYLSEIDAFMVSDQYREIADLLGLSEWHPAVWIGRLFCLDNDFGEHWFDNWPLRTERGLTEDHLIIDPERFQDGRDGPCHSTELRKRFWTDVLKSLELSLELLFDKARAVNDENRKSLNEHPDDPSAGEDVIPDLENRITSIRERFGSQA